MNDQAHVSPPETPSVAVKGKRFYTAILGRMEVSGAGAAVAIKTGLSESTVSRAKEALEHGCAVIAALGLKVVPEEKTCVDPGEIRFLRALYDRVKAQTPWMLDEGDQ